MSRGNYKTAFSVEGDLGKVVGEELQKLSLEIDARLISRTPRDTGAAKANWIVTIGNPTDATVTNFSQSNAAIVAKRNGEEVIRKAKMGDIVFIQNNLPYLVRLNDGWSQQAPKKFIEECINQAVNRSGR